MIGLRWKHPNAPLRTSVVRTHAVGLLAVLTLAVAARAGLDLGALYPWKAVAVFAVGAVLAIGFVGEHHPFDRFGPANTTTTLRAALVTLVASLVGEPGIPIVAASAAGVGLLATALDGVDGWLARRTRMTSPFGARFDMETDVFLVLALSVLAWQYGKAGAWVLLCGLMRYVFVAAGWLALAARHACAECPGKNDVRRPVRRPEPDDRAAIRPPFSSLLAAVTLAALVLVSGGRPAAAAASGHGRCCQATSYRGARREFPRPTTDRCPSLSFLGLDNAGWTLTAGFQSAAVH